MTFRVNYLDIGTNFIANIIKVDSWSHVVNDNTNACIGKEVGNANEYYEFVRQSDGSYIIKSLEDGNISRFLMVEIKMVRMWALVIIQEKITKDGI